MYYREGTHGKEREGARHWYQWQGLCVPGASWGPHCPRRNGQFMSNLFLQELLYMYIYSKLHKEYCRFFFKCEFKTPLFHHLVSNVENKNKWMPNICNNFILYTTIRRKKIKRDFNICTMLMILQVNNSVHLLGIYSTLFDRKCKQLFWAFHHLHM